MRLIKSALCIMVIFALAVSLVPTTASASALAVVGTSFSSVGLTSAEFAASAGPYAIGILAALAAAYGIKAFTQSDTGQAVKEFFAGLIEKRAEATRRSVADQMEALLGNATIDENGNITLGRLSFAEAKQTLLQDDIPISRPSSERKVYLKNYRFGYSLNYPLTWYYQGNPIDENVFYIQSVNSPLNNMFFRNWDNGMPVFIFKAGLDITPTGYITVYTRNLTSGNLTYTNFNQQQYTGSIMIGDERYWVLQAGFSNLHDDTGTCPQNSLTAILNDTYTLDDLRIDYAEDTLYGVDETLRNQTVGLNEGLTIAPDLINSSVLGGASGQISASDYCGALVDYVSGYDTVIDGVNVTGLPEAGTVPRSIEEAPTSDTVIDEAPPSTMTGTEAAGIYSFSLDELFPFCLPFDFVKIIEKFNVEPEAPNFDWRFYIPGVIDYTLHIDLSAWNTAAEVCRTMVLIAFMVGLIMLTRQIFIRA